MPLSRCRPCQIALMLCGEPAPETFPARRAPRSRAPDGTATQPRVLVPCFVFETGPIYATEGFAACSCGLTRFEKAPDNFGQLLPVFGFRFQLLSPGAGNRIKLRL